eukprot:GFKZ01006533.1.p1 GENE.GFKZ01006533.1~~GFKZ01006533.1.p1  ORF type:complete len:694 (+),score=70.88 GFKZ01006533.1:348-2429(+)
MFSDGTPFPFARSSTSFILLFVSLCLTSMLHAQDCTPNPMPEDECSNLESGDAFPNLSFTEISNLVNEIRRFNGGVIEFTIKDSDQQTSIRYQVVRCGCPGLDSGGDDRPIRIFTQPRGTYVDSGPLLGLYLALFSAADRIVEVNAKIDVFSEAVRNRIDDNLIEESGTDRGSIPRGAAFDQNVTTAIIPLQAAPDYLAARNSDGNVVPALVVPIESASSPLARAECIKLIGLLFDQVDRANELFNDVKRQYEDVVIRTSQLAVRRPSVFFNYPSLLQDDPVTEPIEETDYGWDQPARNSYISALVSDASAEFNFGDGLSENLIFPQILERFRSSTFLLNSGRNDVLSGSRTLQDFIDEPVDQRLQQGGSSLDSRFNDQVVRVLKATICGNVWSNQNRFRDFANDVDERGVFEPHRILIDFVRILHPYISFFNSTDIRYQYRYERTDSDDIIGDCPFETLEGNPPMGERYVDQSFRVPQNRFQVEDMADTILRNIQSDVAEFNIEFDNLELFFPAWAGAEAEGTAIITIRASVPNDSATAYERSTDLFDSLQNMFEGEVARQEAPSRSPSPSPSAPPTPSPTPSNIDAEGGGGLGGGAIFGIVVAVLVVLFVVLFCFFRQRRRSRGAGPAAGLSDPEWTSGAAGAATSPGEAGGGGGRQNRDRFRPRMNFGRSAPVPPHPDGATGVGNDDPFI